MLTELELRKAQDALELIRAELERRRKGLEADVRYDFVFDAMLDMRDEVKP